MSCLRSLALSLIGQLGKSREKHLMRLWQALVFLDSLRMKTRPPAHKCLEPLDTSQGHKSLYFFLIQFNQ